MVSSDGGTKRCSSAIVKMQGTLAEKISKLVPGNSGKVIILGDVFLRQIVTAFDNNNPKKPKLGFAIGKSHKEVSKYLE